MSTETYFIAILASVFGPAIFFAAVGLLAPNQASDERGKDFEEEYLLAGRSATSSDFLSSSAGYMLQVSTTFYFIFWGFNYGLSNVFYLISWALGIFIFARFAPELIVFRAKHRSLPEFIAGGRHSIGRKAVAIATLLCFVGVFYVEAFFTADFVAAIASIEKAPQFGSGIWWVLFATITLLVFLYSSIGGLKKVVLTDTWQLCAAYLGMAVIFSYLLLKTFKVDQSTGAFLALLCVLLYGALLLYGGKDDESVVKRVSLTVSLLIVLAATFFGLRLGDGFSSSINVAGPLKQISEPWGIVTLLGFTLINLLWQFCDNSNFQRIGALNLPEDSQLAEERLAKVIRQLIVISPITWGLGIVLGMLIKASALVVATPGTEYQVLIEALKSEAMGGSIFALFAICAVVVSLVAIMMSTCDSALLAAIQVLHTDLRRPTRLSRAFIAVASIGCLVLVVTLALVHKSTGATSILRVMAGMYSAVLVLFPVAYASIRSVSFNTRQIVGSVVLGLGANYWATFFAPSWIPFNVGIVLPYFAGLGAAYIGYFTFRAKGGV